jgi:hypothetical protein
MTTMINPHANGSKRASLNDQINRLDDMLDGLAEGLNDAVADAVKSTVGSAVESAVQTVLAEILASPEIRAKLQPTPAAQQSPYTDLQPAMPSPAAGHRRFIWWDRVRACIAALRSACTMPIRKMATCTSKVCHWSCAKMSAMWARCQVIRPFTSQLLTAAAIGIVVAVGVWYGGPWLAVTVSGVGGFATALTVQAGLWLRKVLEIEAKPLA